jgi:hypothetical protein
MKIVKVLKKILIGIVGIIFFGFAIAMTILLLNFNDYGVTEFSDTSLVIMRNEISSDIYKKGDLVLVKKAKLNDIKVGEEIFVYKLEKKGVVNIDLGIVGELHLNDKAFSFENGSAYTEDFIIGRASKTYKGVGTYLSIIESKWGFLFIILVPSFLIFVYEIYTLIIEVKYGKDEPLPAQQ